MSIKEKQVEQHFALACEGYAEVGVDVACALQQLKSIPISLQCWQGDDVGGFEPARTALGGGLAVTGNYPGKARTPIELRADLDQALALIPGSHRLNLHAFYAETEGRTVERNQLEPGHFSAWIGWARERGLGLDFNPTFFSHPQAHDGFTLSHRNPSLRRYWIEHGQACRKIAAVMGRELGSPCVTNLWIPDGSKDSPMDRRGPRERLTDSLDQIFSQPLDPRHQLDALEGKLFGIGSESYVVGSHDFYLGYAVRNKKLLCLDAGHFHPTESVADKISSVLSSLERVLLHVSRGVRWDSDHVVTLSEDLQAITQELVRGGYLDRVHLGLDYFDASINRVAAWVIGTRALQKALILALLEPQARLRQWEVEGDFTARLAWMEEHKTLPFGPVWDYYCLQSSVPVGGAWLNEVRRYEHQVLHHRS